jgi:thiamine pyrophosphate-dependent acetolactate synthase large subunit-like protein
LNSNLQMGLSIPGTLIHLDVDPGSIDRFHPVDIGLRADAALGLDALLAALEGRTVADTDGSFVAAARAARRQVDADGDAAMGADFQKVMQTIRASLGRGDIVVKDSTVSGIVWANRHLPVYEPRRRCDRCPPRSGPGCHWRLRRASAPGGGPS